MLGYIGNWTCQCQLPAAEPETTVQSLAFFFCSLAVQLQCLQHSHCLISVGLKYILSFFVLHLFFIDCSFFFTVHLLVYKYLCRIQSKFTRCSDSVLFINMLSFFCLFRLVNSFYPGMEFCVRFVNNRLPMRLQHRALSLIEPDESDLENVLFPTEDTARTHGQLIPADTKFQ